MKLKDLIKESYVWERKFGEKLPTLDSIQKKKNEGKLTEAWDSDVKDFGKKSGIKVKPHSGTLGAYGAKPVKPEISKKVVPFFKKKGYKLIKKHKVSSGAYKGDLVFVLQGKDKKKYLVSVNTNKEGTNINFNLHEGKLTEAKETIFDVAARVMKDKQAHGYKTKKGLVKVDMQTDNLLTKVFKKVNPKMKKILSDIGYKSPTQLMNTLWAVVK